MNNEELRTFANSDDLARAAAAAWLDEIERANRGGKTHAVALSGGRITQKFFTSAVEQGRRRAVSFAHVQFFWADERCVPPTDSDSNFKLAEELLFKPLNIAPAQIHRLRGEELPAAAVTQAQKELAQFAPIGSDKMPSLDLILLGMGEDGHVASLFPGAGREIANCTAPFLVVTQSPKPPPTRLTLSYAAIAAARQVWVLVSGTGKEAAFHESLDPAGHTPLGRVIRARPVRIFSDLPAK